MNGPVEWIAAIGTMLAVAMVGANYSRRLTGCGFVLFAVVTCLWVYSGLTVKDWMPLAIQNGLLLLAILFVLISQKKKAEIDKAEKIAEQAKQDLAE